MKPVQKSYRLLKYGDPLLLKPSIPVKFPLDENIDLIMDECINSLVSFLPNLIEKRGRLLELEVDLLCGPSGRAPLPSLCDV